MVYRWRMTAADAYAKWKRKAAAELCDMRERLEKAEALVDAARQIFGMRLTSLNDSTLDRIDAWLDQWLAAHTIAAKESK